jgi:hypothetical protein
VRRIEPLVLFLICAATLAPVLPEPAYASIEVDEEEVVFRLEDMGAAKVFLTGDFNNWNTKMDGMVRRGGAWELRLYLIPGKYRYMFVVDGQLMPDPDNPNRDADGNTFFIFVEEEGRYSIVYEATRSGKRKIEEIYDPYGAMTAAATEEHGLFTASAGVDGQIDGSLKGNVLVGAEYETTAEDPVKAYLLRARGEWVTERFSLGAFHRSGRIGFDDPLSLFTDVGPYAYPLDLFCRGAEVSAGWRDALEGRLFFANRIDGYGPWIENYWYRQKYVSWEPEDRDMIGASLGGSFWAVHLEYLYRHDRGPIVWEWEDDDGTVLVGPETRTSHGLLLEIGKDGWPALKAQFLTGITRFSACSAIPPEAQGPGKDASGYDREWEEGYRALAEISWSRGPFIGLLNWKRTTIERNPELLGSSEYWDDARMDVFDAGVKYGTGKLNADLDIGLIDFSGSRGVGRTFWLQGWNFWLDGSMLRTGLLQFLDSKRIWGASLTIEEGGVDPIPGPYRLEGTISARYDWDSELSRSIIEISGGKGVRIGSYLSIHTDIRYVTYSDERWVGDSGFLDFWAGVRGDLGGTGWASLGIGVAPHRFDRWYFDFTGDGRESYLLDQGLFMWVEPDNGQYLIEELGKAEKSLSEEWRLSFEGGFSF